jgi:acyl-CoA synthetase (NDP forming)
MSRLTPLFAPRGIAVVGASRDPGKLGAVMMRSLRTFPGPVAGINPRDADPAAGRYESVAAAAVGTGGPLDLAVLCVPAASSASALADAARGGARAALVCSGGYAEAGGPGVGYQRDLAAAAADHGITLLGPNTSGFLIPALGLSASFVPGAASVPAGPAAVVAASGGINHVLAFLLAEAGVGVSLAVGLGNAVDVTTSDVLLHLAGDDRTRAVAVHLESVADGPALVAALRQLSARKPVAALVVGRSDVADFARSHTGALATSWRVTRAALRQAGAVVVDDERELADAVTALSAVRLPPTAAQPPPPPQVAQPAPAARRPAVGVVTAQAGPGLLHMDGLRARGVEVPPLGPASRDRLAGLLPPLTYQANPVDTGRPGPGFAEVLATVAADPGIDLVSVYTLAEPDALDLPAAAARLDGFPLVAGLGGPAGQVAATRQALRALGVPALTSPSGLTTAVSALIRDALGQAAAQQRPVAGIRVPGGLPAGPLDEDQAKSVLDALGVATPPRRACASRAEAHAALAALPGLVAVKLLDSAITHKSDVGGVVLGVRDAGELDQALDLLEGAGHHRFLVESMAPPGIDLLAGASRDPVFGPVVLLGLGGVAAEALADVAVALAPLPASQAARLPDQLAGRALLDGFRGGPALDRADLGLLLARLGALLAEHPDIEDIEINPLRLTHDGLIALDGVVTIRTEAVLARGDDPPGPPIAAPRRAAAQPPRHEPASGTPPLAAHGGGP